MFAAVLAHLSYSFADPDLWGHVKFGQDIWETGAVHQVDPYAYTSGGQRWINHEWLSEAVFALLYDAVGSVGLVALKAGIWLLILGAVYWFLIRQGMRHVLAGVLVLFATFFVAISGTIMVRPHLFTFLFFLCALLMLRAADEGELRWLWLAPPMFVLWVNFHGGVLAGLGIFGAWTFARIALRRGDALKAGLPFLASIGALLVNPYGFDLPAFLVRTGTVPRPEILEWHSVDLMGWLGFGYMTLLAIGIAGILYSRRPRSIPLLLLFVITVITPLLAMRLLPLFALAVLILAGEHISDAWQRLSSRSDSGSPPPLWASAIAIAAAVVLLVVAVDESSCIRIEPQKPYPVRASAFLQSAGVEGNLAIPFNWGQYAIWHLAPEIRVSMDGRRETVYSDSVYRESRNFQEGKGNWDAVLSDSPTDMSLVPLGSPTANLLSLHQEWQPVYQDSLAVIHARADFAGIERLAATRVPAVSRDGAGTCFP